MHVSRLLVIINDEGFIISDFVQSKNIAAGNECFWGCKILIFAQT